MSRIISLLLAAGVMWISIAAFVEAANDNSALTQFPFKVEAVDSNRLMEIPENTVTFHVKGGPYAVGEIGEICVVANVDWPLAAYDFHITYDPSVFQVGAIGGGDLGQPVANTAEAGLIRMNGLTLVPQRGVASIATIPFAVIGNHENQVFSVFSLTIRDMGDENFNPIDAEALPVLVPLRYEVNQTQSMWIGYYFSHPAFTLLRPLLFFAVLQH